MYYVILSEGAYSDYSPTYYVGEVEITDKELKQKGEEVGDRLLAWFNGLPERKSTSKYEWDKDRMERYRPDNGETVCSFELAKQWFKEINLN